MLPVRTARLRARLISEIRGFFEEQSHLEVDTPLLAPALIPEPHIEVFATERVHPDSPSREPVYLVPSPEIWMKELLAAGYPSIYQLGHCFRNGESVGPLHRPEFTLLEWYTVGATYTDSARITEDLLERLATRLDRGKPFAPPECIATCRPPALRLTVAEAFERYAGVPASAFDGEEQMVRAATSVGLTTPPSEAERGGRERDHYDEIFQRIFLTFVEPRLPKDRPVILTDYPSAVPTLAEQQSGTPFARRWELYLAGVEVANCYSEERNGERLAGYLRNTSSAKATALVPHPPASGLTAFAAAPPCSGVALGVDRLLMALSGASDIGKVIFPRTFGIFRSP